MKILTVGLTDSAVNGILDSNGVAAMKVDLMDMKDVEGLKFWIKDDSYNAIVLDLERSGLDICIAKSLRLSNFRNAVIGISAGSENHVWADYRAIFLENGGDDLLHTPVSIRELVASLRAVTRRSKGEMLDIIERQNRGAHLQINFTIRSVSVNEIWVQLAGKQLDLLLLLASFSSRIVSHDTIMNHLYTSGHNDYPDPEIIKILLSRIRKKLREIHPDAADFIETTYGMGYRLLQQKELTQPSEKEK